MIVLIGSVKVPPANLDALRPHIRAMLAATRTEDGCLYYSLAEAVDVPGMICISEVWRDPAALDGHRAAPHMADWRKVTAELGIHDRDLSSLTASSIEKI